MVTTFVTLKVLYFLRLLHHSHLSVFTPWTSHVDRSQYHSLLAVIFTDQGADVGKPAAAAESGKGILSLRLPIFSPALIPGLLAGFLCAIVPLLCIVSVFTKANPKVNIDRIYAYPGCFDRSRQGSGWFQALAILRWWFHLKHRDGWGLGLGTAAPRTVCLHASNDLFLSFFQVS